MVPKGALPMVPLEDWDRDAQPVKNAMLELMARQVIVDRITCFMAFVLVADGNTMPQSH
jgi:hypothetical protein